MISHYITEENSDWDLMLPYVMMAYRNRIHEATGESPFSLMYGRDMELLFYTNIRTGRKRYVLDENYVNEMMARMEKALCQESSTNLEKTNRTRTEKKY